MSKIIPAKKEKLIKITKDRDSSEVGVYEEFDPDNPYHIREPRFVHKENDNAEEVEMRPFEISIDELKEKQDQSSPGVWNRTNQCRKKKAL